MFYAFSQRFYLSFLFLLLSSFFLFPINSFSQTLDVRMASVNVDPVNKKIIYQVHIENTGTTPLYNILFFDGVTGEPGSQDGIEDSASYNDNYTGFVGAGGVYGDIRDIRWVHVGHLNEANLSQKIAEHNHIYGRNVNIYIDMNANSQPDQSGYETTLNLDLNGNGVIDPDSTEVFGFYGVIGEMKAGETVLVIYEITYDETKMADPTQVKGVFNAVFYPGTTIHNPTRVHINHTTRINQQKLISITPPVRYVNILKDNISEPIEIKIQNTGNVRDTLRIKSELAVNPVHNYWEMSVTEKTSNSKLSDYTGSTNITVYNSDGSRTSTLPVYDIAQKDLVLELDPGQYILLIASIGVPNLLIGTADLTTSVLYDNSSKTVESNIHYTIKYPSLTSVNKLYSDPDCDGVFDSGSVLKASDPVDAQFGECFIREMSFSNNTTHEFNPESVKIRQNLGAYLSYIKNTIYYCVQVNKPCTDQSEFTLATDAKDSEVSGGDGAKFTESSNQVSFVLKHFFKNVPEPDPNAGQSTVGTGNNGSLSKSAKAVFRFGFKVKE